MGGNEGCECCMHGALTSGADITKIISLTTGPPTLINNAQSLPSKGYVIIYLLGGRGYILSTGKFWIITPTNIEKKIIITHKNITWCITNTFIFTWCRLQDYYFSLCHTMFSVCCHTRKQCKTVATPTTFTVHFRPFLCHFKRNIISNNNFVKCGQ